MPHQETEELKKFIRETMQDEIQKALDPIVKKIDPMYVVFSNVKSFNVVTVYILKTLIILGSGITIIYSFLKYLKK